MWRRSARTARCLLAVGGAVGVAARALRDGRERQVRDVVVLRRRRRRAPGLRASNRRSPPPRTLPHPGAGSHLDQARSPMSPSPLFRLSARQYLGGEDRRRIGGAPSTPSSVSRSRAGRRPPGRLRGRRPADGGAAGPVAPRRCPSSPAPRGRRRIRVRGDASPGCYGPFEFDGRYLVRFEQFAPEDPELDFSGQTPFTASLPSPGRAAGRAAVWRRRRRARACRKSAGSPTSM